MTANELQRIATRLSNQCHCRHWLNFFNRNTDVMMAIQCLDPIGLPANGLNPIPVRDLEGLGFRLYNGKIPTACYIYLIPRTNEDGTPFEPKLF